MVVRRPGNGVGQHLYLRAAGERQYRRAGAREQSGEDPDERDPGEHLNRRPALQQLSLAV